MLRRESANASTKAYKCPQRRLSAFENLPGIRLEPVANNAKSNGAEEAVVEDVLPALLLSLLAGLHAKEPSGRRVVGVAVCVAALARGRARDLALLL